MQCPFVQSHPQGFCVWALDVFAYCVCVFACVRARVCISAI